MIDSAIVIWMTGPWYVRVMAHRTWCHTAVHTESFNVCVSGAHALPPPYLHRRPLPPPPLMRRSTSRSHVHPTTLRDPRHKHYALDGTDDNPRIMCQWLYQWTNYSASDFLNVWCAEGCYRRSVYSRSLSQIRLNVSLWLFTNYTCFSITGTIIFVEFST